MKNKKTVLIGMKSVFTISSASARWTSFPKYSISRKDMQNLIYTLMNRETRSRNA